MIVDKSRKEALMLVRTTTMSKMAVAPAPGTTASMGIRNPLIPDNSPNNLNVAKAVLKGGTDSYNFTDLAGRLISMNDPRHPVHGLRKRLPTGNLQRSIGGLPSQQATTGPGVGRYTGRSNLGSAPQEGKMVLASVAKSMVAAHIQKELIKTAGGLDFLKMFKPGGMTAKQLARLERQAVKLERPTARTTAGTSTRTVPKQKPIKDSAGKIIPEGRGRPASELSEQVLSGRQSGPIPYVRGMHDPRPLSFKERTRNLLTPAGMRQYLIGPKAGETHYATGLPVRTKPGAPVYGSYTMEGVPGTLGGKRKVWSGVGPGEKPPSLVERWRAQALAPAAGRRVSRNPLTLGKDITDKYTIKKGPRSGEIAGIARTPGIKPWIPFTSGRAVTPDSALGGVKRWGTYGGLGMVGAGYWNPAHGFDPENPDFQPGQFQGGPKLGPSDVASRFGSGAVRLGPWGLPLTPMIGYQVAQHMGADPLKVPKEYLGKRVVKPAQIQMAQRAARVNKNISVKNMAKQFNEYSRARQAAVDRSQTIEGATEIEELLKEELEKIRKQQAGESR